MAERLREAAAEGRLTLSELDDRIEALYAAKTYGDLEIVVDDLPGVLEHRPVVAPARHIDVAQVSGEPRVGGTAGARSTKVVFSGAQRRGRWVVPNQYRVMAVFGGAELDLTDAQLESRDVDIEIKAVFGGAVVIVPPDVRVVVEGNGVFGGFADEASTHQPPPGAPVVRIGGKAVFGGVAVKRTPVERP